MRMLMITRPALFTAALFTLSALSSLQAQPIAIPNHSFELQSGVGQPQGVNINIDSWQKIARPDYFEAVENNFGIFWVQTAGAFLDTNPYQNRDGAQAAYLLGFPQVTLFQELNEAVFQPGLSYDFALGVNGKDLLDGSILQISLYYQDGGNQVTIGSPTSIIYNDTTFPNSDPLNLTDFHVTVPTVIAEDAWAGKNIGIKIESLFGDGSGYWDVDNARLTAVPEPGTIALGVLGLGGFWAGLRRGRRA